MSRSPRFFKSDILAFLQGSKVIASQIVARASRLVVRPTPNRRKGGGGEAWLRSWLAALQ